MRRAVASDFPGFFFRISPNSVGFGAGLYAFDPEQLVRYRAAVVDAKLSRSLRAAVDKARKAGPYELSEPNLKRVPPGPSAEHRNADFLRYKQLGIMGEFSHPKALFDDGAVPYVVERLQELRPSQAWLSKALE